MDKPLLYDVCCKAGGCTKGFQRAGFRVIGVDIEPQPRYCGDGFIQMCALEFMQRYLDGEYPKAQAFGGSPPCQLHTQLKRAMKHDPTYRTRHVDIIADLRKLFIATGQPYVIENVIGAPLIDPIMLCGSMFGLRVYRHRLFESNIFMLMPPHVPHQDNTPPAGRGKSAKGYISVCGNGGAANLGMPYIDYASAAMGIDWMNRAELSQAIPPAYTHFIGTSLLDILNNTKCIV